jgi:hypothetical protein
MALAIPANCAAVTEQLLLETGRLQEPMYNRAARTRPILRLQSKTRGAWQNGRGVSLGAVTFERSFPLLTGDNWATIAASDGNNVNACLPPSETVNFGETVRTYTPRHYSVNTQKWCVRDIAFGWQFAEFLGNVTQALSQISEWVWYRRMTQDYFNNAGHHLTLSSTAGLQDDPAVYNTSNLPTGPINQLILENIYADLWREAGDKMSGVDEATGSPVFTAIMSPEMSQTIVRSNPDIRQDQRFAYMGKGEMTPLIPGLPVRRRNYGGFVHEIDPYPRRFIFSGGGYIEIAPWIVSSTTSGFKWEQNAAYQTAPFEEIIIWHEDCYQDQVVNPVDNPSPGFQFDPHNWMGQFEPRNILHETCNPDGDIIFLRALFASAARPINPKVGWCVLAARCGTQYSIAASCYTS